MRAAYPVLLALLALGSVSATEDPLWWSGVTHTLHPGQPLELEAPPGHALLIQAEPTGTVSVSIHGCQQTRTSHPDHEIMFGGLRGNSTGALDGILIFIGIGESPLVAKVGDDREQPLFPPPLLRSESEPRGCIAGYTPFGNGAPSTSVLISTPRDGIAANWTLRTNATIHVLLQDVPASLRTAGHDADTAVLVRDPVLAPGVHSGFRAGADVEGLLYGWFSNQGLGMADDRLEGPDGVREDERGYMLRAGAPGAWTFTAESAGLRSDAFAFVADLPPPTP